MNECILLLSRVTFNIYSRMDTGFHRKAKFCQLIFVRRKPLYIWSNEAGKIMLKASQFVCRPAPTSNEIPDLILNYSVIDCAWFVTEFCVQYIPLINLVRSVITGKSQTSALMYWPSDEFLWNWDNFCLYYAKILGKFSTEKNFHNAQSLQENNARSAANQSAR